MQVIDPIRYIQKLDIASYQGEEHIVDLKKSRGFESGETTKPEAFVNNKSLVSFVSQVSGQNRKDILNSSLLAQKVADKKYPEPDNIMDWYDTYLEVLTNIGWVIEGRDHANFSSSDTLFEMEKAVINILGAIVGQNYLTIIKSTLDAMKSLSEENNKVKVFERNSHDFHKGNFQIALATEENGAVSIQVGAFMLQSTERINRILFFNSGRDKASLSYSSIKFTLNQEQYTKNRNAVIEKLGKLITSYIGKLDI